MEQRAGVGRAGWSADKEEENGGGGGGVKLASSPVGSPPLPAYGTPGAL